MRRRNGSKKIPNVILRPVPGPSRDQKRPVDALDEASEFDPERDGGEAENGAEIDIQSGTQPFRGVIICCTGVPNKAELFTAVEELGGQHSNDLTDLITHLIAEEPGSAKYNFAVKTNIPIMSPEWVLDSHVRYINGEDFTLRETEQKHRLPRFLNLRICVSGENKLDRRHQMARFMHEHGATYANDLDDSVTHLLICGDARDQRDLEDEDGGINLKIAWALEENEARQRARIMRRQRVQTGNKRRLVVEDEDDLKPDILIVWSEWFWDCLAAYGRYEERAYSIDYPRPVLKALASTPTSTPSFASATSSTQQLPAANRHPGTRNNGLETEPAILRALKGHGRSADELWKRLIQQRKSAASADGAYFEGPGAEVSNKRKAKEQVTSSSFILESASSKPPTGVPQSGNSSSLAHINSLRVFSDPASSKSSAANASQQNPAVVDAPLSGAGRPHPFSRVASTSKVPNPSRELVKTSYGGIFSGVTFAALGEASSNEAMKEEIRSRGGVFLDINGDNSQTALQKADIVVVRLESASKYAQIQTHRVQIRTECWFEQCIFEERVVPPQDHITFQPVAIPLPIAGLDQVCIAASGLNSQELLFLKRFARAIGLRIPEFFKRKTTTHLVCPSRSGLKYEKALEWGVQVVDLEWVYRIGVTGCVEPGDVPGSMSEQQPGKIPPIGVGTTSESMFGKPNFDQPGHASPSKISTVISPPNAAPRTSVSSDAEQTRFRSAIPSSQSPSPLKSPVADVVRRQLAVMLDRPEIGNVMDQAHQTAGIGVLGTGLPPRKKARPVPRYKSISGDRSASRSTSASSDSITPKPRALVNVNGIVVPHIDSANHDDFDIATDQDSLRVMYYDPGQQAAKKRLMALLESEAEDAATKEVGLEVVAAERERGKGKRVIPTRRSTRMAGF